MAALPTTCSIIHDLPSFVPMCSLAPAASVTVADIQTIAIAVQSELNAFLLTLSPYEQARLFGTAFQLVLHDASEADIRSVDFMGADGCLSNSAKNVELTAADSYVNTVIEPMWQKYCDKISRADFWVLFAKLALEKSDPTKVLQFNFQYGRKDATAGCNAGLNRLIDNQRDEDDLFNVFVEQMGLSSNDAMTLMGGRSVGFHESYQFSWDNTPDAFDNNYFQSLIDKAWISTYFPTDRSRNLWFDIAGVSGLNGVDVPYTTNGTWEEQVEVNVQMSAFPSILPTAVPTVAPSAAPSAVPTFVPTATQTVAPTVIPTVVPTQTPTTVPTFPPTKTPTAAPTVATTTLQAGWGQCGGQLWTGPTQCVANYECTVSSVWYSQCTPVVVVPGPGEQTAWGQCGGQGWTGPTKCVAGCNCVVSSQWYSQCYPTRRLQASSSAMPPVALTNLDVSIAYPISIQYSLYYKGYLTHLGDKCGMTMVSNNQKQGCINAGKEIAGWAEHAMDRVKLYAANNEAFLEYFAGAFERLTTVGYNIVGVVVQDGKFGDLTEVNVVSNNI